MILAIKQNSIFMNLQTREKILAEKKKEQSELDELSILSHNRAYGN